MGEDGRRVAPVTAWGVVDFVAAIGLAFIDDCRRQP